MTEQPRVPTCITCSDAATPMRVLEIDAERGMALCVDADGDHRQVDVGLLDADAVSAGETLLVHAGAALAREPTGRDATSPADGRERA